MARKAAKKNDKPVAEAPAQDQGNVETVAEQEVPTAPPETSPLDDSLTFSRCVSCKNARDVDAVAGTLLCAKYDMAIDAEADEIPDDCVEFVARDDAQTNG